MKPGFKLFFILVVSSLLLFSCEARKKTEAETNDSIAQQKYACPMHPEVTGKEGDTCSKCGMKLTKLQTEAQENYVMTFKAEPSVVAGKASVLSLTPIKEGNEQESVPLDIQHDKKIHLIVVSKDLSYFDHIHPEIQSNGSYQIKVLGKDENYSKGKFQNETHFNQGGDYVLFADYLPTGATHQLERIELKVDGPAYQLQSFTHEKLIATTDGYEVSLLPKDGKLLTGSLQHIAAIIKKDGKEISADSFENYLSAKAHVVVISEDTQDYLHVHPDVSKGRLDLHTTFAKPGIFRGWLQFQTNGTIHTADFVLNVQKGATEKAAEEHHH